MEVFIKNFNNVIGKNQIMLGNVLLTLIIFKPIHFITKFIFCSKFCFTLRNEMITLTPISTQFSL